MDVHTIRTLEENEAKRWRQGERGLHVIQLGENRNPVTTGKTWSPTKARAIIAEAMEETDGKLHSAVTSKDVEEPVAEMLVELGQRDPGTLHLPYLVFLISYREAGCHRLSMWCLYGLYSFSVQSSISTFDWSLGKHLFVRVEWAVP